MPTEWRCVRMVQAIQKILILILRILRIGSFAHRFMKEEKDALCSLPWLHNLNLPDAKSLVNSSVFVFPIIFILWSQQWSDKRQRKYFAFLCSCNFLSMVPHLLPTLIILFKLSMRALAISLIMSICLCVDLRLATFYVEETKPACLGQALPMSVLFMLQQTGELRKDWFAFSKIHLKMIKDKNLID